MSSPQRQIAFIGAGNMAAALIRGLLRARFARPEDITVSDPSAARRELLAHEFGVRATNDNLEATRGADIVVLAVKPQVMDQALNSVAPAVSGQKLVLSIAAGVPLARIERALSRDGVWPRVVRAMPNSPALIGEGATAIAAGKVATTDDMDLAQAIFASVGVVVRVDESLLDAVTGLSGSGPAYAFLIIEALCDAGVKMGLPRQSALELTVQTLLGSARMVQQTRLHPAALKDQVTSPGGTTIAGLHALEAGRLRATLIDAVERATERSRDLGHPQSRDED